MIQLLPNELQIQVLSKVITKTNFKYFCTLRTVCKKWGILVPLVMQEVAMCEFVNPDLYFSLKLESIDWKVVLFKNSPTTYDYDAKTFTFLFDHDEYNHIFYNYQKIPINVNFAASMDNGRDDDDDFSVNTFSTNFGKLTFQGFVNGDIYKHKFDHQNSLCFKRVTNENKKN
ncbi:5107_t:CDS:2, partial [Scutellospora calospora]